MTTQPQALVLADWLDTSSYGPLDNRHKAAALLRTQHAEIERLNACLKWEQNRAERIGTHGPGCEKWGSTHYECLLRSVERKNALLRQALDALKNSRSLEPVDADWVKGERHSIIAAITKELQ